MMTGCGGGVSVWLVLPAGSVVVRLGICKWVTAPLTLESKDGLPYLGGTP